MRGPAIGAVLAGCLLAGCARAPMDPISAADYCEQRARAAQAPTGSVAVGASSGGRVRSGVSIGVSADLLSGRDPTTVYNSCVFERTGRAPIRPPSLRP
ncbi:hypothetical protein [Pseudoroseicyclus aestuarii]|uniref:Lipoprotein n=1 Tax=Pseudoroseicyclus aestuarii TaxID=1795041 RepID=A0A318SSF6_9RHOB|nr:hypothetical protein [Pseudoroseicyclus aestuarii]PYE84760.1 hypothetical protein DFP88_102563 [Pseudoroseicyclus aestuarii]